MQRFLTAGGQKTTLEEAEETVKNPLITLPDGAEQAAVGRGSQHDRPHCRRRIECSACVR